MSAFRTQDMVKPQTLFEQITTNDETAPFKPLLTSKPNAIVPLERSLRVVTENGLNQYGTLQSLTCRRIRRGNG